MNGPAVVLGLFEGPSFPLPTPDSPHPTVLFVDLAALDGPALVEAVARNIYGGSATAEAAAGRLAAYIRVLDHDLKAQDVASLAAGALHLADPGAIPATTGQRS